MNVLRQVKSIHISNKSQNSVFYILETFSKKVEKVMLNFNDKIIPGNSSILMV